MVMIFIFAFGSTYLSTPYAYAAEVLPTKIRSQGMSIALFCGMGITVCFTQTAPIALSAIGWKFNLVFICCNIFFFAIFWFFCPEVSSVTSVYPRVSNPKFDSTLSNVFLSRTRLRA